MARGRFISSSIITDRQIHELSSDTCRLAYTWAVTLADREGRIIGEPDLLAAQLFPRRREITPEMIEGYILEWIEAEFVIWYIGGDGDRVLQFVNFEKHQIGLRKEREAESIYDNPDDCRIIAGAIPEQSPVNIKLSKDNIKSMPQTDLFDACKSAYETKKGLLVTDGRAFTEMINEFEQKGVTISDYISAIDAMDADPKYKGSKPTSYKKWAIGYAEDRKQQVNTKSRTFIGPNGEEIRI